ncbi:MAG: 2-succinylbenzoate--CoA ligase [Cyanobacteriota bacterium]|nr:2-succinylbenzoate--CoA ligase [Cyanobacteriota bacterium]
MESNEFILKDLQDYCDRDRIIGWDNSSFYQQTQEYFQYLQQFKTPPVILLAESDPFRFLSIFMAAVAARSPLFLGNPDWRDREWHQVWEMIQPDLIFGNSTKTNKSETKHCSRPIILPKESYLQFEDLIAIPTGGTSGEIKFCLHSWQTLKASILGFLNYFNVKKVNSFCILPLYHVSGLMQFLRSFITKGVFYFRAYKELKTNHAISFTPKEFFISIVPTQLQFFLNSDPQWLSHFDTVLVGGAPTQTELLETARNSRIRLAPTYGMTETASQIVTLKPDDFLLGNNSSGQVLPHASVKILKTNEGELGKIAIASQSLCLGYYPPDANFTSPYLTDDLGYFDDGGYLHIIGRNSSKIITGGENVFPTEVEAAILATQWVSDVCVVGLPDETWGEVVTAVCIPTDEKDSISQLQASLKLKISKFKQPKHWVKVAQLPRNSQGKVNRQKVKELAIARVASLNEAVNLSPSVCIILGSRY